MLLHMRTVDEVRCYQTKLTFRRQADAGKIQSVARRSGLMCAVEVQTGMKVKVNLFSLSLL